MELHILPILTFLSIAMVVSQAALPPEIYWKKMLPNADIPKAVKISLPEPEWMEGKGTSVNVGKGGVHVNTGAKQGGGTTVNIGPHKGVNVNTRKPNGDHTNVHMGPKGGVAVNTGKPGKGGARVGVGKGGITVRTGPKKKPVYVGVHPGANPFQYKYAASEAQLHDDPTRALFFLEKDMRPGQSMNLHFTRSTNAATFLPREEAKSLPFSSNKMPEILQEFSVLPNSDEAKVIEKTIKGCEEEGILGEQKYCATSMESLVDYAKNTLGKNVKAMSTEAKIINDKVQKYIVTTVKKVAGDYNEAAVCHKQKYPYAVFYCHKTKDTFAYVVSLMGADGSKAKAMAVCHRDTSAWNPKHLAFQVLKMKPGSAPICHFLPEDHIVWVPNN